MKYSNYGYYDWDLALYANTMSALCRGSIESSLFGTSFLTNHAQYIAFLLTPIYAIFFHPFTLIFLKVLFFFSGAFVVYLIAEQKLNRKLSIFLMLLFTIYPPNIFMLLYEFHFENLAIIFIALMFYFIDKQNLKGFVISALIATLIKENICLVVVFMGIFAYFKSSRKMAWGLIPILLGSIIFCLSVFWIIPGMRSLYNLSASNQYLTLYSHYLNTESSGLFSNFISNLFSQSNLNYISFLFTPFNITPLLSPFGLFPAIPLFMQHLLSSAPAMKTPIYHYMASLSVFLFYASIDALFKIKPLSKNVYKFLTVVLGLCFLGSLYQAFPLIESRIQHFGDHVMITKFDLHKKIPKDQTATASFEFLTPLSNLSQVVSFHQVWENHNVFNNKAIDVNKINYALINLENDWLWTELYLKDPFHKHLVHKHVLNFYFQHNWKTTFLINGYALLQKSEQPEEKFIDIKGKPSLDPDIKKFDIVLSGAFRLNGLKMNQKTVGGGHKILEFKTFWECLEAYQKPIRMIFSVRETADNIVFEKAHQIGYLVYPTDIWKKGQHIEEIYNLYLNELPKGNYKLFIRFTDFNDAPINFLKSKKPNTVDVIELLEFKAG